MTEHSSRISNDQLLLARQTLQNEYVQRAEQLAVTAVALVSSDDDPTRKGLPLKELRLAMVLQRCAEVASLSAGIESLKFVVTAEQEAAWQRDGQETTRRQE